MKHNKLENLKTILSCSVIVLLGAASVTFGLMYIDVTGIAFLNEHKTLTEILMIVIVGCVTIVSIICQLINRNFVYKITFLALVFMSLTLAVLYVVKITGFWDKIGSVESLRKYVSGFGAYAVIIFIAIQFLQVVVLPVPGFITVSAGVLLFGAFRPNTGVITVGGKKLESLSRASYYSHLAVVSYNTYIFNETVRANFRLAKPQGKDKVILTFMFLFPFFPDDVLCFVAGLSSMSVPYYIVMITITRIINIVVSSYSINGSLIPYDTWWGILIWIGVFVAVAALCYVVYKYGDKIEDFFAKKFKRTVKK